jgi:hypothetical protein
MQDSTEQLKPRSARLKEYAGRTRVLTRKGAFKSQGSCTLDALSIMRWQCLSG